MNGRLIDVTPTERAAIVTSILVGGESLTPADVAQLTQCSVRGGYYVLERLSRVLPIQQEKGRWSLMDSFAFPIK